MNQPIDKFLENYHSVFKMLVIKISDCSLFRNRRNLY